MIHRGGAIDELESGRILAELKIGNSYAAIKRALQDICEHYEKKRIFVDPDDVRTVLHSHLGSPDTLVRRWTIKALGLIAHPEDMSRIVDRLRVEADAEAQTWGIAALLKRAADRPLRDVCAEAKLEGDKAIVLAARLYAPQSWVAAHGGNISVSLDDEELALKWAIFLIGYNKAPHDLFNPRHENSIFLGELNKHPTPLVSEYSVWGMVERQDLSYADCRIPLSEAFRHPPNVRKWLYRLAAKNMSVAGLTADGIANLFHQELDRSAREGLARGLAFCDEADITDILFDSYQYERDEAIRELLLAGMASRATADSQAGELLRQRFKGSEVGGKLRRRLMVVSQGRPMYSEFQRIELHERASLQPSFFNHPTFINAPVGEVNMGNVFKAGGDINAANLAGDSISGDVRQIVGKIGSDRAADKDILAAALSFAERATVPAELKTDIANAVKSVVEAPSPQTKGKLLEKLKAAGSLLGSAGAAAAGLDKLLHTAASWVSGG